MRDRVRNKDALPRFLGLLPGPLLAIPSLFRQPDISSLDFQSRMREKFESNAHLHHNMMQLELSVHKSSVKAVFFGFISSNGLRRRLVHKSQHWNLERKRTGGSDSRCEAVVPGEKHHCSQLSSACTVGDPVHVIASAALP